MHARKMAAAHPHAGRHADDALIRCIEECYACAQACTACADACLAEPDIGKLVQCIRIDLDCAEICATTGALATRRTGDNGAVVQRLLQVCAETCRRCAEECDRHAGHHEHCRICADACRRCREACQAAEASTSRVAVA